MNPKKIFRLTIAIIAILAFSFESSNAQLQLAANISPDNNLGPQNSDPGMMFVRNGMLHMSAQIDDGWNAPVSYIMSYDGSIKKAIQFWAISYGVNDTPVIINNKAYLFGRSYTASSNPGNELYSWDFVNYPVLAYDFTPGNSSSSSEIYDIKALNNKLYITVKPKGGKVLLMEFDPTTNVAKEITKHKDTCWELQQELAVYDSKIFMNMRLLNKKWAVCWYDPAIDSFNIIKADPANSSGLKAEDYHIIRNKLYFKGWEPSYRDELYVYEESLDSVRLIKDIWAGQHSGIDDLHMVDYNGKIFLFTIDGQTQNTCVTTYDPATDNFVNVFKFNPKNYWYADPSGFELCDGKLYFTSEISNAINTGALYVCDGVNVSLAPNSINGNKNFIYSRTALKQFKGSVYMSCIDNVGPYGRELYKYTPAKTPNSVAAINSSSDVSVYPNPVTSILNISVSSAFPIRTIVTSIEGKVVFDGVSDNSVQAIDTKAWTSGVYIYSIYDAKSGGFIANGKINKI